MGQRKPLVILMPEPHPPTQVTALDAKADRDWDRPGRQQRSQPDRLQGTLRLLCKSKQLESINRHSYVDRPEQEVESDCQFLLRPVHPSAGWEKTSDYLPADR